jgi:hypothetical protein
VYAPRKYPIPTDSVYAESAPIRCYPFHRFSLKLLAVCCTGSCVIFVILYLAFSNNQNPVSHDELLLILGMSAFVGAAFFMLGNTFGLLARLIELWPVIIRNIDGKVIAQLANRGDWCLLEDLNPVVLFAKITFVNTSSEPIPEAQLPADIRNDRYGVWLSMSYQSRQRWALLQSCLDEDTAITLVNDWNQNLKCFSDGDQANKNPPSKLQVI